MLNSALFSSSSDNWSTPHEIYDALNAEFNFTLDPCADDENHKCDRYYTKEQNGLKFSWGGEHVFCNPPYSEIDKWVKKAWKESTKHNTLVVLLIPARTDTRYFHDYIYHRSEIRFIKGRLKFGNNKNPAPFPSMVVIFRSGGFNENDKQLTLFDMLEGYDADEGK